MHCVRLRGPIRIRSADDAVDLLTRAARQPLEPEVLTLFLDRHHMGSLITGVTGTTDPDMVVAVVELMCRAAALGEQAHRLVLASVRPEGGILPGDVDRWLEASAICHEAGIELVEWFVIAPGGISCPRDLLGEPERWRR